MVNRVSTSGRYAQLVADMQQNLINYNRINAQLSSGHKILNITDDPIASVNILNTNRQLGQIETFSTNVEMAKSELSSLDDLLTLATGYLQSAWDKAVQANNQTYGNDSLQALKVEIDETLKTMVDLANTEYNDNYIFGGTNTKTPPYEIQYGIDADGNPTEEIIGIKYTGTPIDGEWQRQLEIADGVFETMNVTGAEAFGNCDVEPVFQADGTTPVLDAEGNPTYQVNESNGIMGELINLRNAISDTIEKYEEQENLPEGTPQADKDALANEISTCYDTINGLLDGFATAMDKMVQVNESFGADINKLEMSDESLADNKLNLKDYISGIQDLDLTEAISDWYSSQMAYQASMQASSSIMSMSLLNYM